MRKEGWFGRIAALGLMVFLLSGCTSTVVKFSQAVYATDLAFSDIEPIALVIVKSSAVPEKDRQVIKILCNRITHTLDELTIEASDIERSDFLIPAARIHEDQARLNMTKNDMTRLSVLVKPYKGK